MVRVILINAMVRVTMLRLVARGRGIAIGRGSMDSVHGQSVWLGCMAGVYGRGASRAGMIIACLDSQCVHDCHRHRIVLLWVLFLAV